MTSTPRAAQLLRAHELQIHRRTDRLFILLMLVQWAAGIVAAAVVEPRPGVPLIANLHHAIYIGAAITALPCVLAWLCPGHWLTRHVIAVAQMGFSALLIHLTNGRIESHFHVFGSLAFLAAYRDWRVLLTGSLVTILDQGIRGYLMPESVYGISNPDPWRWAEHVGWLVFEDMFLWILVRQSLTEMLAIAERQADFEAARDQITAASEAKSAFLAHMSHEIRTPMTAILGNADLMSAADQSEHERADSVETIRRNGHHLLTILNDILDMSKIEAGKLNVERIPCSPLKVVDDVMRVMRPRAVEKGLRFRADYLSQIPRTIHSDPTRLRQILINLVSNAIKFTDQGEVRVTIQYYPSPDSADPPRAAGVSPASPPPTSPPPHFPTSSTPPSTLSFSISDTGIGMSPAQLDHLFQPFSQGDASTNRRFGGTGLGLSICKRLAELLHGRITVRSNESAGSTFTLSLDLPPANLRLVRPELEATLERLEHAAPSPSHLARGRVLLADDAPDNRKLMQRLLERAGLEVETAENGRVAVDKALAATNGHAFDVVLMDMQMPEMDGYQAASALRARHYPSPIVALTAHASDADRQKCLAAGCTEYLAKPFDLNDLLNLVARHVQPNEPAPTHPASA
jgi:signal transduction histidine kinase/ActR/RegA family two-component response regulator